MNRVREIPTKIKPPNYAKRHIVTFNFIYLAYRLINASVAQLPKIDYNKLTLSLEIRLCYAPLT